MALIFQILRNMAIVLLVLVMLQNVVFWSIAIGLGAFSYYAGRMLLAEIKAAFRQAFTQFCFMLFVCAFAVGAAFLAPYAIRTIYEM